MWSASRLVFLAGAAVLVRGFIFGHPNPVSPARDRLSSIFNKDRHCSTAWGVRGRCNSALLATVVSSLGDNARVLDKKELDMAEALIKLGQGHLLESWPPAGTEDSKKKDFMEQVLKCDAKYPGGLKAYLEKARKLLEDSAKGVNPFEGYTPQVPDGESLVFGTPAFEEMEEKGLSVAHQTAFVLVAGGLGERLGYNGIKLALPVEVTTRQCYLSLYVSYILELQRRTKSKQPLPLIIMTSEDTDAATKKLLAENKNFGMEPGQIRIMMQDKVPALGDSTPRLITLSKDKFSLDTKPHGHGDVHHLLHRTQIAEELQSKGFKYLLFFQDTNALVLNSVLPTLGVSVKYGYHMNSICVPRKAQEAAGAITALTHEDGSSLIINVEYNQLDPLLRATVSPEGDINDPETGFSPFPGNTNNIVFELNSYVKTLQGPDQGVVNEFVNPKYKDDTRTTFTKPTRLECMMQDFPLLMAKELPEADPENPTIGFTSLEKWLSFSPAKNSLEAGAAGAKKGIPPNTASSSEAEYYAQAAQRITEVCGCSIGPALSYEFGGIPLEIGAHIILSPSFATTTKDLRNKISKNVSISSTSTLIIEGAGVRLEELKLDGALIIKACPGANIEVNGLTVNNKGWEFVEISDPSAVSEEDKIRGYVLEKHDTTLIEVSTPGNYVVGPDGKVKPQ